MFWWQFALNSDALEQIIMLKRTFERSHLFYIKFLYFTNVKEKKIKKENKREKTRGKEGKKNLIGILSSGKNNKLKMFSLECFFLYLFSRHYN